MKEAEHILQQFTQQTNRLQKDEITPILHALTGIQICKNTLGQLKKWKENKGIITIKEEIYFFKDLKSVPMSYLIFYTEMRHCELRKPKAGKQFQISFLQKKLKKINKFFFQHAEFSTYMESGQSHLNQQYFTKSKHTFYLTSPLIPYPQFSEFETSHDLLWAKIKAMHLCIDQIKKSLETLQNPNQPTPTNEKYNLKWTASKAAMTELVYALYSAQAVNSGKADLKEIARAFQHIFQIDLSDLYHTYSEIRARKIQLTKFMDHLKIALEQRMYEADD